jgi:Domain of unknown function (DUF3520)/von Willebrand factor
MTSEHARGRDDINLAAAPAPSQAARQAAIAKALARFDTKNRARLQASVRGEGLLRQTAILPSRRRSVMPRVRHAIAASLVALLAGSATWVYVGENPLVREVASPQLAPQVSEAERLAALPPPQTSTPQSADAPQSAASAAPPTIENFAAGGAPDRAAPAPAKRVAEARRDGAKVAGRLEQAPGSAAAPPRIRQGETSAPAQKIAPAEPMPPAEPRRDKFAGAQENGFRTVLEAPVSTFSIDVDTASYGFVRASLNRNVLPPPAAVRTEELVNYFPYAYPAATSASEPFRTTVAVFPSPWAAGRKVVHVGIKGYAVQAATRPRGTSTLIPIAKDVKIEVEFNPAAVAAYRLIGYETRLVNRDDFANDKVDAGDVGSGQTVTALYEIVPVGGPRLTDLRDGEASRAAANAGPAADEYALVKIRYKLPASDVSAFITTPVDRASEYDQFVEAPNEARFATSVAAFAEILRGGRFTGTFGYDDVLRSAAAARGEDPFGYRSEFLQLVRAAKTASAMQRR